MTELLNIKTRMKELYKLQSEVNVFTGNKIYNFKKFPIKLSNLQPRIYSALETADKDKSLDLNTLSLYKLDCGKGVLLTVMSKVGTKKETSARFTECANKMDSEDFMFYNLINSACFEFFGINLK